MAVIGWGYSSEDLKPRLHREATAVFLRFLYGRTFTLSPVLTHDCRD
jgi:hypothetical protein